MLFATSQAFEAERAKGFKGMSQQAIDNYVNQAVILEPSPTGASGFQTDNRASLAALGVLVGLVLLIACANVANLMTAQAAARAREMALRISIGAGRWRLVQLVLVESAWIALLAAAIGWLFAWWAAPFVVGMIGSPDDPARIASASRLAGDGFRTGAHAGSYVFVWADSRAAGLVNQAGQRAEGWRGSPLASSIDACAGRRASGVLFSGPVRRRPLRDHIPNG